MKKAKVTRLTILQKAYDLIYLNGYQTTSIDDILATTVVTKGAFYYHFKNKDEMGIAIIIEILKPEFINRIELIFKEYTDPVEALYTMINDLLSRHDLMKPQQGCPLSNFIQELVPKNKAFTKVLNELTEEWKMILIRNIEKGKETGIINADIHAESAALFIISGYWGIRNFGRMENGKIIYQTYLKELKKYLSSFR